MRAPLNFAIDAQISPSVPGGTETALLALLSALGKIKTNDHFVALGLRGYEEQLRPCLAPNTSLTAYPKHYRWYSPGQNDRHNPGPMWRRVRTLAGPAAGMVDWLHQNYAHGQALSPRARALTKVVGPAAAVAYRAYHGLRYGPPQHLTQAQSDTFLRTLGVRGVHFPYPLHFDTSLPFVYEPWGLPHRHLAETFRPGEPEWMDQLIGGGCRRAAMIVTATRWVKRDIVSAYGIDPKRIAVIPRLPVFAEEPDSGLADALGDVPARFALYPAMTWPTKNHVGLLHALAKLKVEHGHHLELVCTGRTDTEHFEVIKATIRELGLGQQVRFLGRVSAKRLERLFKAATFLVHPSKFEGLGLPPIEAFHHGLPVVCSNAACIPEVVGDAALLFDPNDIGSMTTALRQAIETPDLLNELRARGRLRLQTAFPGSEKLGRMFLTTFAQAAGTGLDDAEKQLLDEMLS